ncbi:MAG: RtcB family protein [Nitrospinota bacterium]
MKVSDLIRVGEVQWEIPASSREGMKVPARIFVDEKMLKSVDDTSIDQLANAACLPGVRRYTLGMPDIHQGYGLPIGGVMATDPVSGVISPGAAGYDINCGVRLMTTPLSREQVSGKAAELADELSRSVPHGIGRGGKIILTNNDYDQIAEKGSQWAIDSGFGIPGDRQTTEAGGCLEGADPAKTSDRAKQRGRGQMGTIGSGNHFCEIQWVEEIFQPETAREFGLQKNRIVVMIHSGSRGFGHQIATDYLKVMESGMKKYGISVPDRELACSPLESDEGKSYLAAMSAAANYAWSNRQVMMHLVRIVLARMFGIKDYEKMPLLYDVAHNIIKLEEHDVDGEKRELLVHRKGATRAFPPGHSELSEKYRKTGQPVIVPGDMGRMSFILAGRQGAMEGSFGSSCHGAGRALSRRKAFKLAEGGGKGVKAELARQGIEVRAAGKKTLAEEMPLAYKDVSEVVNVVSRAGFAVPVARLRPIAVVKG